MNKIKMVVTDLDGTLLRNDKTISKATERMISTLNQNGIPFVVATARPVRAVQQFLPFLSYDAGVFHNGAVIVDHGKKIANIGIQNPYELIHSILKEQPDCHIATDVDENFYTNFDLDHIWPGFICEPTKNFEKIRGMIAEKIIIETDTLEKMSYYEKYMSDDLYLQLCENTIAMIMNKEATKVKGIQMLAKRYGIQMDEIAAFGDDYNDIEMLKSCGFGIAMDNALDEVKEAANQLTRSNEEDGVAEWIASHLK